RDRGPVGTARLPEALEVHVEVALDRTRPEPRNLCRTADIGPEVVLLERGLIGAPPLPGVQAVSLVIVEHGGVEAVGARFRGGHDLPGRARAVLRLVARAHDL